MILVLLGYRGCGKSTVGRMLADRLGWCFVDTDDMVCHLLGAKTIAEAWQRVGEVGWRQSEDVIVEQLMRADEQVIALGGGTVTVDEARRALIESDRTLCIYLKCDAEELYRRTTSDSKFTETRPNLAKLGGSVERVRETLAEREPLYRQTADHVIDVTAMDVEEVVDAVKAKAQSREGT